MPNEPAAKPGAPKSEPLSRREKLDVDGVAPEMPGLPAPHLVGYLFEVGPTLSSGMGPAPLSFSELSAWQSQVGIELQPWEVRLLRRLSLDYLLALQKAKDPACPAPWAPEDLTEQNREVVSRKVQNAMRSFIAARGKP